MSGFEPRISGVGSDRSTNWATTYALNYLGMLIEDMRPNMLGHFVSG